MDHVVYLESRTRGSRVRLSRYPEDRALEEWLRNTPYLERATSGPSQRRCHERMLRAHLWEMRYSDLDDAVRGWNASWIAEPDRA